MTRAGPRQMVPHERRVRYVFTLDSPQASLSPDLIPMRRLTPALLLALSLPVLAGAQQPSKFDLSIPNIMRGPELYGREPQRVRWSADGKMIYFYWNAPGTKWSEPLQPYRVAATPGAKPEKLTEAQIDSAGALFADGS